MAWIEHGLQISLRRWKIKWRIQGVGVGDGWGTGGGLGWFERSPFLMLAYAQKGKIKNLIKKHLSLLQSTLKCRKAMSEKLDFKLFRGRMHPNPLQIHTFGAPLTESPTRPTYGVVRRRGHSHGET